MRCRHVGCISPQGPATCYRLSPCIYLWFSFLNHGGLGDSNLGGLTSAVISAIAGKEAAGPI